MVFMSHSYGIYIHWMLAFGQSFAKTVLDALLVKSRPSQLSTLYSAEIHYCADQSSMPCPPYLSFFFYSGAGSIHSTPNPAPSILTSSVNTHL